MEIHHITPLFPIGRPVMTQGVNELLGDEAQGRAIALDLLLRHQTGDWGDMDASDKAANDRALKTGERIFSAYHLKDGTRVWVITEWDRSYTTILLPEEY